MNEFLIDPAILDLMGSGPGPETTPYIQRLLDGLEKLPKKYREVIDAIYFERIPKVELADRLGIHRTVVDRLLQEATEALRVHLEVGQVQAARVKRIRPLPVSRKPRQHRDGPK